MGDVQDSSSENNEQILSVKNLEKFADEKFPEYDFTGEPEAINECDRHVVLHKSDSSDTDSLGKFSSNFGDDTDKDVDTSGNDDISESSDVTATVGDSSDTSDSDDGKGNIGDTVDDNNSGDTVDDNNSDRDTSLANNEKNDSVNTFDNDENNAVIKNSMNVLTGKIPAVSRKETNGINTDADSRKETNGINTDKVTSSPATTDSKNTKNSDTETNSNSETKCTKTFDGNQKNITNAISRNDARMLNHDNSKTADSNSNSGITNSTNSTMVDDANSKYFTVIHDMPSREGPCKKCPQMQMLSIKQWWKVQQNLAPTRFRHTLRIGLVVLASALLLLIIFLLARLPSEASDVLSPAMYDLPPDDAFRPNVAYHQVAFFGGDELQDLQLPMVDHPDVVPDPVRAKEAVPTISLEQHLKALARKKELGYHPLLGMAVPPRVFLEAERFRKQALFQLMNTNNETLLNAVLHLVRNTVDAERKEMKDKEMKIWSAGETPLRILLVSTWRSGSTFLGQVLQKHPGVFQHYEPFSYLGVRQVRSGSDAFQSQQLLHRLLDCRFKGQDEYLNYTKHNLIDMVGHNKRIWNSCSLAQRVDICSNATFLTESCNMFPIQLVKTVRLRLNLTQLFLGETRLNAKVVFLVRDPRATINSRRSSVSWCDASPDCSSPEILCSDLKDDLKVSAALERLYPKSFTMIRYEDLANDPDNVIKRLIEFLGMEYSSELSQFVAENTQKDSKSPWTIARKSAARVSRWKDQMTVEEVDQIQKACKPVIERLGYDVIKN